MRSATLRADLRRKESFFVSFTQHLPLHRASAPWAVLGYLRTRLTARRHRVLEFPEKIEVIEMGRLVKQIG